MVKKTKTDKKLTKDQAVKKLESLKKIYLILGLKELIIKLKIQLNMEKLKKV